VRIKQILVAGVFISVAIGLYIIGAASLNQLACEGQPINFRLEPTAEQQIWGERFISQSFVAPRNGLNRIDVLFQTYERPNSHDVIVSLLEILPDASHPWQGPVIFEQIFNAATLPDRSWHSFEFASIANSAGKTYLINIRSPQSTPGDAITVGGIEWNAYAPGSAFLGPVPARADIAFRACFQMTTWEKLAVLSGQLTQHRPALWGNIAFYYLSLTIYAALCLAFFWQLAKFVL
jgi:hypothetical protein